MIYPTDITAPSPTSLLFIIFLCKKDILTTFFYSDHKCHNPNTFSCINKMWKINIFTKIIFTINFLWTFFAVDYSSDHKCHNPNTFSCMNKMWKINIFTKILFTIIFLLNFFASFSTFLKSAQNSVSKLKFIYTKPISIFYIFYSLQDICHHSSRKQNI